MVFRIQDVCLVFSLIIVFLSFFSTYVFQVTYPISLRIDSIDMHYHVFSGGPDRFVGGPVPPAHPGGDRLPLHLDRLPRLLPQHKMVRVLLIFNILIFFNIFIIFNILILILCCILMDAYKDSVINYLADFQLRVEGGVSTDSTKLFWAVNGWEEGWNPQLHRGKNPQKSYFWPKKR